VSYPHINDNEYSLENEYTLIHVCAKKNLPGILRELLASGVQFNLNMKDTFGRTPLLEACVQGNEEIVRILVDAGANVNIHNKYQNTPLHVAALNNYPNIVNYLLEHKSDIMKQNYEQKSCLKLAEDMQHAQLVDVLDFHMKREIKWRNRNCLLKIALNRNVEAPQNLFKGFSVDVMREIIKYA
jgi:ankyrin repeat protein